MDGFWHSCGYHDIEAPIDVDNHRLLFLNSHVRFDEIYDGSSKTLLISSLIVRTPWAGSPARGPRSAIRAELKSGSPVSHNWTNKRRTPPNRMWPSRSS
jgi:hypothetical protein